MISILLHGKKIAPPYTSQIFVQNLLNDQL